jgi:predicted peroxiredoxin
LQDPEASIEEDVAMRHATRSLVGALIVALAVLPIGVHARAEEPVRVVVHLGHYTDDLHAASMAMSLATLLQKQGAQVTLFLDREGVRLVDARGPGDLAWGSGPSVVGAYQAFIAAGGSALVCPHCAHVAGLDVANLRSGARIGDDASVAKLFLEASRVIDY